LLSIMIFIIIVKINGYTPDLPAIDTILSLLNVKKTILRLFRLLE
jgi:hypothetical protein